MKNDIKFKLYKESIINKILFLFKHHIKNYDITDFYNIKIKNSMNENIDNAMIISNAMEISINKLLKIEIELSSRIINELGKMKSLYYNTILEDIINSVYEYNIPPETFYPFRPNDKICSVDKLLNRLEDYSKKSENHYKIDKNSIFTLMNKENLCINKVKSAILKNGFVLVELKIIKIIGKENYIIKDNYFEIGEKKIPYLIVGYDDNLKIFKLLSSKGKDYGEEGFIYITYEIIQKICLSAYTFRIEI